jgi:hypothetical protein
MEVRNAARGRESWSASGVSDAAWKAALQNRRGRSPKVCKIAAPQELRPRRVMRCKFANQARWAHSQEWLCHRRTEARLAYPPTEEAQRAFGSGDCSSQAPGVR